MAKIKVLIVDDERLVRWSLRQKCEEWDYTVFDAENGAQALTLTQAEAPDVVLLDVRLPDIGGLEVLEKMKATAEPSVVIMMTGDPQLDDVKAAIRMGAYDFIGKPLDFDELSVTVRNALEASRLKNEVENLRGEVKRRTGYHEVIAESRKMQEAVHGLRNVKDSKRILDACMEINSLENQADSLLRRALAVA